VDALTKLPSDTGTATPRVNVPGDAARTPFVRHEARRGWQALDLAELWRYRDLLYFLTAREIMVRYKQTVLGIAWAVIQPLFTVVVFSIFFGRLAGIPSDGVPYPVFAFCALLPWQMFATALGTAGNSLVANQNLITKVYFPRLAIPLSVVGSSTIDFCVAFLVLLAMMLAYGVVPGIAIVTLPFFLVLALAAAMSAGLWLSALNVRYRDVRHVLPFLVQLWMFATPVAYSSTLVPEQWRWLYGLNPMAGVVEGFRWALLGVDTAPGPMLVVSTLVTAVMLTGGLYYFRRVERGFADVV
jgi:lipopolysaccharide transport system permease protein